MTASCCAAATTCTDDGADVESCQECLDDDDGALCDDFIECFETNCE